jgi:hypothetical protein
MDARVKPGHDGAMSDIPRSQKIHCQELNSGKYRTGFFLLDDTTITAELYGYDDPFYLDVEDQPLYLRTSSNNIISLYSNIVGSGTNFRRKQKMTVHHEKIISNVAVIGPDLWSESDRLKYVTFMIENTKSILGHTEKLRLLSVADAAVRELFDFRIGEMSFRIGYGSSYTAEHDYPTKTWPYFEIEFYDGIALSNYLEYVISVVEFFSAALGVYLQPGEIKICRLSLAEMMTAIESDKFNDLHSVEYIWSKIKLEEKRIWHGHSFILAYDDAELSALQGCLFQWVERLSEWKRAYSLMMASLSLTNEISANRLMAVWRWFEEIPGTGMTSVIADKDISAISEQATNKAKDLGYEGIQNRIVGALKRIGTETNFERFERLVASARAKFGVDIFDDKILDHLDRAIGFRGRVAHGHIGTDSESEFRQFAKSTHAMEALCFLLTIRDMPMTEEGIRRVRSNPFVSDYKHL